MPFVTSESKKFIFIHIPKTAGMSLYELLKQYADPRKFGADIYPGPHSQANSLKNEQLGDIWNFYFKFSFVRNPWARLYSYYNFIRKLYPKRKHIYNKIWVFKNGTPMNREFNDWILHSEFYHRKAPGVVPIPVQKRNQLSWITDDNYQNIIVDFVGKVENINTDWKLICNKINIPFKPLPKKNSSSTQSYRDVYTQKTIDFVAKHHKRDIETFGYDF
jgi:hypothetical protein